MKKNTMLNIIIADAANVNEGILTKEKFLGKIKYLARISGMTRENLVLEAQVAFVQKRPYLEMNYRWRLCDSEEEGWEVMAMTIVEIFRSLESDREFDEWRREVGLI